MKFLEPTNFDGAMSPVSRASWILGIGIFEYPIGHRRPALSFCWSIAHLTLYLLSVSLAKVPEASILLKESTVASHNYHLSTCCCTIFMITSMIVGWKSKTFVKWNRLINEVNKNLNKFEIAEDYGKTFKYQIRQLAVCLVQQIIISAFHFFTGDDDGSWELPHIAFWISVQYQLLFINVVGCTYCGSVRYIGNRFQRLNSHLIQLNSKGRNTEPFLQDLNHQESTPFPITHQIDGNLCFPKVEDQRWTAQVLREARSIHRDLCLVAKEMNQTFGIQIIFFIVISFCSITSLLFTIYQICTIPSSLAMSSQIPNMMPDCCWLIAYSTAVYYIAHSCSMVSYEAQQTGVLIHERVEPDISNDIQAEIDAFSLQILQDPLQFTAHGFFALDYSLIRGMTGSVTTYLVIMIQLRSVYDSKSDPTSMTTLAMNSTS